MKSMLPGTTCRTYYVKDAAAQLRSARADFNAAVHSIRRNNLIAWLAARNDGENYGQVLVYRFPKDSLTLGPAQIDATIDQDSEISQLLSLWGQRGSQVIRGNMLVLPINGSLLYVEPLFLQSEQSSMPQLQRVIVAYKDF